MGHDMKVVDVTELLKTISAKIGIEERWPKCSHCKTKVPVAPAWGGHVVSCLGCGRFVEPVPNEEPWIDKPYERN